MTGTRRRLAVIDMAADIIANTDGVIGIDALIRALQERGIRFDGRFNKDMLVRELKKESDLIVDLSGYEPLKSKKTEAKKRIKTSPLVLDERDKAVQVIKKHGPCTLDQVVDILNEQGFAISGLHPITRLDGLLRTDDRVTHMDGKWIYVTESMKRRLKVRDALRAHPDWSNAEIASHLGCGRDLVWRVARELGLPNWRWRKDPEKKARIKAELLSDPEKSYLQVGRDAGCSAAYVHSIAKEMGLPRRPTKKRQYSKLRRDIAEHITAHPDQSYASIARQFGCTTQYVWLIAKDINRPGDDDAEHGGKPDASEFTSGEEAAAYLKSLRTKE